MSKLSFLKHECLKYVEIIKIKLELRNYLFVPASMMHQFLTEKSEINVFHRNLVPAT